MLRERLDKLITDYRTIEWVMTNDVKDTSERIIARHSKLADAILSAVLEEIDKLGNTHNKNCSMCKGIGQIEIGYNEHEARPIYRYCNCGLSPEQVLAEIREILKGGKK